MSALTFREWLRDRISRSGAVSFRWFMEQALYHPEYGYYASGRAGVGRKGDFFTNVSVGSAYAKLLAWQFAEMWERTGRPESFTILEQGANDGVFARDLLLALPGIQPELAATLRYVLLEPFAPLGARQRETLQFYPPERVRWCSTLAGVDPFIGVHFSNELVDAFPVHLVVFRDGQWRERHVGLDGSDLALVDGPLSGPLLEARLASLGRDFPEGYETEVNLEMETWVRGVAEKLVRGFILTVDYGYPRDVYYQPERSSGTLACYARHQRSYDPLAAPGDCDMTAHVDFTSLAEAARSADLELAGFTDQHHFLVGLAARAFSPQDLAATGDPALIRQFKTLMHPELMGTQFKAIAFSKRIPSSPPLLGFQYARDAEAELWPHR